LAAGNNHRIFCFIDEQALLKWSAANSDDANRKPFAVMRFHARPQWPGGSRSKYDQRRAGMTIMLSAVDGNTRTVIEVSIAPDTVQQPRSGKRRLRLADLATY